jgi:hypothetical protein
VREQNRLRLQRLVDRYERRLTAAAGEDEAIFLRAFVDAREAVLRPVLREVADELCALGHAPEVVNVEGPGVELRLGLRRAASRRNAVGLRVIRGSGYPLQILAYLVLDERPFDLERFALAAELSAEKVEQVVVDAVEHLIMCNAP